MRHGGIHKTNRSMSRHDIDREILVAALTGEANEEEMRRLEEWRSSDPENERRYRRVARVWRATGRLADAGPEAPAASRILEIAERVAAADPGSGDADAATHRTRTSVEKRGGVGWRAGAVAAAVVAGIAVGMLLPDGSGDTPFGPSALVTGQNEVATVTLEDRTVVRLAPETRLEFSRTGSGREVTLDGRAFFAVAERSDDPFRVRLAGGTVEVLGTRFDVEARGDALQVAVVEGEVRVDAEGERISVGARQIARGRGPGTLEVREVDDVYRVVDWLGRFLAFESTPVPQVAEELERRFGVRIEIADGALAARTVTGWFSDQSPEEMIAGICRVVEARCTVRGGTVRMEVASGEPGESGGIAPVRAP